MSFGCVKEEVVVEVGGGGFAGGLLTSASGHRLRENRAVGAARVVVPDIEAEVPPLERAAGRHLRRARVARPHVHARPAACALSVRLTAQNWRHARRPSA